MSTSGTTGVQKVGALLLANDVRLFTGSAAPTNGAAGTGFGKAGPGSIYAQTGTANLYLNTNTKASPTWTRLLTGTALLQFTALAANGAISATVSGNYAITKAGVLADTLAAPAASPGGDGITIFITSDTANAHVITFTGGTLDTGSAVTASATFNAFKGASLKVISYNARWKVASANGVSFA